MTYYFSKKLAVSFEEAMEMTVDSLKKEGFGVLTQIDVKETLKKKLDVNFRRYVILGACNPPLAYEALKSEDKIGLMLPCNVIVQEPAGGGVEVAAVDPASAMLGIDNLQLKDVAEEVRNKLKKVIDNL